MDITHPLQTVEWEEFKKSMGTQTSREDGYLITWHKLGPTPFKIGYLAKSKLPPATDLAKIKSLAKTKNAIMVRLEPDELKKTVTGLVPGRHLFTPTTFYLDLTKPEEELLAAMHPKARYNIRLAQKKGVVVKEDSSSEAFERYLDLTFGETTERQKFYAHNRNYHESMWKHLHPAGIAHLFTATYEGKILVTWILFVWQDKLYFPYGASSHDQKDVQAPSLMLWETARWGKSQDCQIYDLWGAEEGKGFNRFKQQFGPTLVEFVGTWDLVVNPILYPIFRVSEEIRWKILQLVK